MSDRENGRVSDAADFVDEALRREASWERAGLDRDRVPGLTSYGASVGAVRGTIRNAGRRYPAMTHDDVTALSSELWSVPVVERRLAAIVLLQSRVEGLGVFDLTRIEGFLRDTDSRVLADPLAVDVVGLLIENLDAGARSRADTVLDRWAAETAGSLARAAVLSPLRALRAGAGDLDGFRRRSRHPLPHDAPARAARDDAVATVEDAIGRAAPGPHRMV